MTAGVSLYALSDVNEEVKTITTKTAVALKLAGRIQYLIADLRAATRLQIIAAERTGRRCRAIEISPPYVDVAIRRWEKATGQEATLDGDGRTFAAIKNERFLVNLGAQDAIAEEVLTAA